jgi:predicted helicase
MNNIEKGFLYENQIKNFIINNTNFNAYLWNECPETILVDNKLISSHRQNCTIRKDIKEGKLHNHKDIGIDIIQVNNDNICNGIIQCKNGYSNGICISDISGIMIRSAFNKSLATFIYYTNSLSKNINHLINLNPNVLSLDFSEFNDINFDENNIYFIKQPFQINNDFNDNDNDNDNENENASIIYNPYEYQTDAVNQIKEHFKENNRSILGIPCGLGKTFISYLISLDYNHIIIISPLKEFAFQNLSRYIDYGYNKNNTVLIDSDGIRDVEIIKSKIQKNKKLLISSTFKSVDIISECLDLFNPQNTLFIIDEFHNLSKNNISDKNDDIYKLLISNHKILFMSATPRIYDIEEVVEEVIKEEDEEEIEREEETEEEEVEEEEEEEEEENNNYIDYEDNFNQLFGKVVYNMTLTYAIDNKYITDYKIWLPSIHENNEQLNEELSVYNIDSSLKNRCNFLFSCILPHFA